MGSDCSYLGPAAIWFFLPAVLAVPYPPPARYVVQNPTTATTTMMTTTSNSSAITSVPPNLAPYLTNSTGISSNSTGMYNVGNNTSSSDDSSTSSGSSTIEIICIDLIEVQIPLLSKLKSRLEKGPSPDKNLGNNLYTFLANRILTILESEVCEIIDVPISCDYDGSMATSCSIDMSGMDTGSGVDDTSSSMDLSGALMSMTQEASMLMTTDTTMLATTTDASMLMTDDVSMMVMTTTTSSLTMDITTTSDMSTSATPTMVTVVVT